MESGFLLRAYLMKYSREPLVSILVLMESGFLQNLGGIYYEKNYEFPSLF